MEDKLQQLKAHLARVADLKYAAAVLAWDQRTYMPPGGAQARADQIATLQGLAHQFQTDEKVGALLDALAAHLGDLDYDSDEASMIRVGLREYTRQARIPNALVMEIARIGALAKQAWVEARAGNDFSRFEPLLTQTVDLQIQYAECFDQPNNIYDPLLDKFEPGLDYTRIDAVFSELKPPLIELVQAISENRDAVDDSVIQRPVGDERQMAFSRLVAAELGYDFERGRLDLAAHPFTITFSADDVRITTRIFPDNSLKALMSSIHEAGHGMHGQNASPALYRTGLDQWVMMVTSESQSRLYENNLGRSRPFWKHFFPKLQEHFAPQFDDVNLEAFYRAINKSEPSLIRVEADEVTYGLHIILRFELENDLINGRVKVADLPKVWNERMEAYLGVVPLTDSDGVLQDIHWSQGAFGYFPDYLLGSIFAVQLWNRMLDDHPDIPAQVEAGQFETILAWQREHIQQHGFKYTLPELTERVLGGPLSWEPYMEYLRTKYGEIYGL